ncbi:MAG: 16S rRNA (cytosine(1402)-N(4))-methyltransferase RsmH [Nitrospinae bacterium]|nr:16S rRNA (cytosine(1402)-N(4))-methyltransferase RsmH [Nitrospinota bacterium]
MEILHVPIMVEEVLQCLDVKPGGLYIDATLGDGGHAEAILERSSPSGTLIGMDKDQEAIMAAGERLARFQSRAKIKKLDFINIKEAVSSAPEGVDGILMDLGVSTRQLLTVERGFSFSSDGPLDMRMDRSQKITVSDLVNTLPQKELAAIIKNYGEEKRWAKRISFRIIEEREKSPITATRRLADIVSDAIPRQFRPDRIHPATKTFQALRIAVNGEIGLLEKALPGALDMLKPGGRLAVISFHSLEDRIVKQFFVEKERGCVCPPKIPQCACGRKPVLKRITRKAVCAGEEEVRRNPRSRSAKLRAAEKLA